MEEIVLCIREHARSSSSRTIAQDTTSPPSNCADPDSITSFSTVQASIPISEASVPSTHTGKHSSTASTVPTTTSCTSTFAGGSRSLLCWTEPTRSSTLLHIAADNGGNQPTAATSSCKVSLVLFYATNDIHQSTHCEMPSDELPCGFA